MAKTKKSLPALLGVEFKNQSGEHTGIILEDRGLFWKVRDDADEEYQVKKTSITRQFQLEESEPAAPAGTLSASLSNLLGNPPAAPTPAADTSKTKDPDLVTLADLCTEYGIVGRIARRRLRAKFTQVGTGSRWEWKKSDPKLAEVRAVLAPAPAAAPEPEVIPSLAGALEVLGMTREDLEAGLAAAGEQGAADEE